MYSDIVPLGPTSQTRSTSSAPSRSVDGSYSRTTTAMFSSIFQLNVLLFSLYVTTASLDEGDDVRDK